MRISLIVLICCACFEAAKGCPRRHSPELSCDTPNHRLLSPTSNEELIV